MAWSFFATKFFEGQLSKPSNILQGAVNVEPPDSLCWAKSLVSLGQRCAIQPNSSRPTPDQPSSRRRELHPKWREILKPLEESSPQPRLEGHSALDLKKRTRFQPHRRLSLCCLCGGSSCEVEAPDYRSTFETPIDTTSIPGALRDACRIAWTVGIACASETTASSLITGRSAKSTALPRSRGRLLRDTAMSRVQPLLSNSFTLSSFKEMKTPSTFFMTSPCFHLYGVPFVVVPHPACKA